MQPGILLRIAAVYTAAVGLIFVFAPEAAGRGALPADASPALIAYVRLFGSPFLGIAVLDWLARHAPPSATRNAILLGNMVGFGVIAAVDVWGSLLGEAREVTKVFAVIHVLFAAAFIWAWCNSRSAGAA